MGWLKTMRTLGKRVERGEDLGETGLGGVGGELLEGAHPLGARLAGQVVDAEMKRLVGSEGDAPLDGYGNVPGGGDRSQEHGGVDVVVIGDRNQRHQPEFLRDLPALEIKGKARGQGRRPVAGRVVQLDLMDTDGTLFSISEEFADQRIVVAEGRQEVEGFFRLIGVTVKRNARRVLTCGTGIFPEVRDAS